MAFRSNSNIRSLASEQEYEDQGADDWGFIQNVVAPPAPAPAPVAAPAPFNPVGFDWTQGVQNIGGTIYQPNYESVQLGHGEEGSRYGQGALQNVLRYKEGQTGPGQAYEIIDPTTGKVTGTGKFKENSKGFFGDLFGMVSEAAADLAPVLQFTPLGPAVAAINAVNAARTGDVLPLVASAAGFGGYSDIANAAKAASALKNEDYLGAIVPGLAAAGISDVGGFNTKDIGSAVNVARAIESENPLALLSAAAKFAPTPDSQAVVGGGAETEGFFDAEEAQAVQDDIDSILARYPEQPAPAPEPTFKPPSDEDYEELESILLRYPEQQIPDIEPKTSMPPQEMARFLEANIEDSGTIDTLMQDYFPELYSQRIDVTGTRDRDLFPEFTQPLLTAEPAPEPIYEQPPTPAPSPAPPAASPAPIAPPAAAPAAPAKTPAGVDPMWAFLFGMMMTPEQQKPAEQYQTARTVASPFGMDLLI